MSTFTAKPTDIQHDWYIVDAAGKTLGRLASRLAIILRGKHKPIYTPHMDTGDCVIVINAEKIAVTGNKAKDKTYYRHSGYPGGIKSITFEKLVQEHPERILQLAVKRMLPKGALGSAMFGKLKVYAGKDHPHAAQLPKPLPELKTISTSVGE